MLKVPLICITLIFVPTFSIQFEECQDVAADTFIAVTNDCRSFIYCGDGEESSFQDICPEDTYFNAEEGECKIDFDNICPTDNNSQEDSDELNSDHNYIIPALEESSKEIATATLTTVTTTKPELSTIYEHFNVITPRPKCVRQVDAYYPHFQRCEYYFKCIAGYLTILKCNFYHAWDYQKEMCVPFNMVKCYANSRISTKKPKRSSLTS